MKKEMQLGGNGGPYTLKLKARECCGCQASFVRKRFGAHYLWKPSPDVKDAILKAIFGKNR